MTRYCCYFHGFASGPDSQKGTLIKKVVANHVDVFLAPDLNGEDFSALTMESWMDLAQKSLAPLQRDDQLLLCGSSLGAYTAALLAADAQRSILPQQTQILLLAPAFGFSQMWSQILGGDDGIQRWRESGSLPFYHYQYQREMQVSYAFYESCANLNKTAGHTSLDGCIMHGLHDEVLGVDFVRQYAAENPQLRCQLLEDDHALLSDVSQRCLQDEVLRLLQQFK